MDTLWLFIPILLMGAFMYYSQWRARKRQQQKMDELQPGQRVMTIGGIVGRLASVDREADRARLEVASGVEIEVSLRAISHSVEPTAPGG